jgi:hypothetical protein
VVRLVPSDLAFVESRCLLVNVIQLDNPVQLAEELCRLGLDACHEIVFGPRGYQEGLDIGSEFFPLWELTLPENRDSLARLDFDAIKARRSVDWSVAPPAGLRTTYA